jgi:hypothetical protein
LKEEGQFAVSERHMLLLRYQSSHDISEGAQTLVDVLRFLEPVARGA